MTLWDENADSAYEAGRQSVLDGVWVLVHWPAGWDLETQVFETEAAANTAALIIAKKLWDRWCEDDWPIQPETWDQVFQEILNRCTPEDVLEVNFREVLT